MAVAARDPGGAGRNHGAGHVGRALSEPDAGRPILSGCDPHDRRGAGRAGGLRRLRRSPGAFGVAGAGRFDGGRGMLVETEGRFPRMPGLSGDGGRPGWFVSRWDRRKIEPGRYQDEGPQHDVRIAKPFAVGEFQVTVDEFKAFVAATAYDAGSTCYAWNGKSWEPQSGRSWRDPGFAQTGSHPAACLNWNDAQAYAKWLSGKTGRAYRLPSEAEWEYAARGQTQPGNYPRYFFGDSEADFCKYGNGADQTAQKQIPGAKDWTVLPCSDGYAYTSPVGSFRPNAFGLFDMHGNVWQWVEDCYHDTFVGAPTNGKAWTDGKCETRVLRGGSWNNDPGDLRAADRDRAAQPAGATMSASGWPER